MAATVPSATDLWSGDAELEPMVTEMYRRYGGQLNHRECVRHLREAEWQLELGVSLGRSDLLERRIAALEAEVAQSKQELQLYLDERADSDREIHRQAMENAQAYASNQEDLLIAENDKKSREMILRLGTMEAAQRAAEARAIRAEEAVKDADERQAAATKGLRAEVARLEAEVAAREALRDANIKLQQEIDELRLGGRAAKMAIADAYEEDLAMSRLLWEMCGPTKQQRELWVQQNIVQLDAVGQALTTHLHQARQAYGALVPVLWERVARVQAIAKALDVEPGLEQLAEEARRVAVGPADVDRIARELARVEHAEQRCDLAVIAAKKALVAAETTEAEVNARVDSLAARVASIEEDNPGIFDPKTEEEAAENGGKLSPEEIEAAEIMQRLLAARAEAERAATARSEAETCRAEREAEHRRCDQSVQELRRERTYWREGLTLPERIAEAEARQMELEADYSQAATKMQALHKKIRWLWLDRLGHPIADLAIEYHERAPSELLSCSPPYFAKAERLAEDFTGLVAQRLQDILASRRRIQNLVGELKARQWLWSSGTDRLHGWQHNEQLHALLSETEPATIDGYTSETARARLQWARDREIALITCKQQAEASERGRLAATRS